MKKILLVAAVVLVSASPSVAAQTVKLVSVPAIGSTRNLTGKVKGVPHLQSYAVYTAIRVNGGWWTKPTSALPLTTLRRNGAFTVDITTSGEDVCADEISVFVVPTNSLVPMVNGQNVLPLEILTNAVAAAMVDRTKKLRLDLAIDDWVWKRKDSGVCMADPGPNFFSRLNVKTDGEEGLRLAISNIKGRWTCAEVVLSRSLGYGTYRFEVATDLRSLPAPVVLGLFIGNDTLDYAHREVGVEFSNGMVGNPASWQYVIQPYAASGQLIKFEAPDESFSTVHEFEWLPGQVTFRSYIKSERDPQLFREEVIVSGVPVAGDERVHLNLWLQDAVAPSTSTKDRFEVVVNRFAFWSATLE
jgi:hypothetical protein